MPRCFVIQPFDGGGPYDKRYKDVLLPAITDADLEAYRVDEDHSVAVPIDAIEQNIRTSEICLADITLDNANIWYEVGYAFASNRPVVMICAKSRPTKYPFDVQHRHITSYGQDSTSDFDKLRSEVTARLKAQVESAATMQSLASLSPVKTTDGLSSYEIAAMVSIMENRLSPNDGVMPNDLLKDMRRAGYTDVATSLSLESLTRKGLVEPRQLQDEGINGTYFYTVYSLTGRGLDWMLENQDRFILQIRQHGETPQDNSVKDEDIPF
jgi:hypothetical protein